MQCLVGPGLVRAQRPATLQHEHAVFRGKSVVLGMSAVLTGATGRRRAHYRPETGPGYHAGMQHYHARWMDTWRALSAPDVDPALLPALLQAYSEPQRRYHTLQHLDACLKHFDTLRAQAQRPGEVELALWFHDAIYEIGGSSNEARSADWARQAIIASGGSPDAAQRVHALVMATCHNVEPRARDQEILLDVDLAILGARPAIFDAYESQIRAEYASVPLDVFRTRRRRILTEFLNRPRIYHTAQFHLLFEQQAHSNLARSIQQLVDAPPAPGSQGGDTGQEE